ncbi:selenoneine biosynthesis selenosugar synthase SenB [Actinomadura terrae]|uniref:selenoneine biosynthesis selenosugar synthase SenB n=1 Tax=Actinomadura terrae TaxID=604353 RepID=UPI001FA6B4F6|nr:selenoneine biosynthesis selenosugar synthase SenB [Actinomadura terrae]
MILIVTPAPVVGAQGNGVTAQRWAKLLRRLGHEVEVREGYRRGGAPRDALIALHARKSADAVRAFHADHPKAPVVIAMTGTDLYPDLVSAQVDPEVLAIATRLVVLQREGAAQLGPALAGRTDVIVQSGPDIAPRPPRTDRFEVAFLAHIRPVKDPLRPAAAVRLLPAASRTCVVHLGEGRDPKLAARAAAETRANPRYEWRGAVPREEALRVLAGSRLLLLTSLHEGGANVVSEALAAGVPVVSSAIPGSTGLLGAGYPGYFPPGDSEALAALLYAAEEDHGGLYRALKAQCAALRPLVDPEAEKRALARLLRALDLPAHE